MLKIGHGCAFAFLIYVLGSTGFAAGKLSWPSTLPVIHDEGTVVGFTPVSPEARSFFQENVASEPYQWMDGANPVGGASPRPGPDRGTAGIRVRRAAAGGHPEPQQRFPDQTQPDPDRHAEERGAT